MQDEVEEYLAKRGMKKKFFANQLGVSPSILSQWFGGMIRFPKWRIEQIQKIISEDAI
jgi:DNA-binding transcriptional regulator YdaS (Cro superfamily)